MRLRKPMIPLYARHFCTVCGLRVFPYDKFERDTEAPGESVLLTSANARRQRKDPDDPRRTAWCWSCGSWTTTYRETLDEIIRRYEQRDGVTYRARTPRRRRRTNNVLPLPRRRTA